MSTGYAEWIWPKVGFRKGGAKTKFSILPKVVFLTLNLLNFKIPRSRGDEDLGFSRVAEELKRFQESSAVQSLS